MYKTALLHDITDRHIFGDIHAWVYSIKFQKRGLLHMHLLLSLFPCHTPSTAANVDSLIQASWPDPEHEPVLFDIVKCCMVYGPCGHAFLHTPCMCNGKCSKGFPKPFQSVTVMRTEGYPIYARPHNSCMYNIGTFHADNRWIVPYNPYLLMRYTILLLANCFLVDIYL
jgi:hypothetical protein